MNCAVLFKFQTEFFTIRFCSLVDIAVRLPVPYHCSVLAVAFGVWKFHYWNSLESHQPFLVQTFDVPNQSGNPSLDAVAYFHFLLF